MVSSYGIWMERILTEAMRCSRSPNGGLLSYLPTFMFFINYFFLLNLAIMYALPRRQRVAGPFRLCLAFTLAFQAYELWAKAVSLVIFVAYEYINIQPSVISMLFLGSLSIIPLLGCFAIKRRRRRPVTRTMHGPRTELGSMRYYLRRPPPRPSREVRSYLYPSRSRSQEYAHYTPVGYRIRPHRSLSSP